MKVPASTILSFVTGRLYSTTPPTVLFGPMLSFLTGRQAVFTHMLPGLKDEYSNKILEQCPEEFQNCCKKWVHTDNWQIMVNSVDIIYGEIELHSF